MRIHCRKIIAALMFTAMAAGLAACGQSGPAPVPAEGPAPMSREGLAPDDQLSAEEVFAQMTTQEKIGLMIVPGMRTWTETAEAQETGEAQKTGEAQETGEVQETGETRETAELQETAETAQEPQEETPEEVTELNRQIADAFEKYHVGGAVLFEENMEDAEQTAKLTEALQEANAAGGGRSQLLICTDQEGGSATAFKRGTQTGGSMALAATGDPAQAETAAGVIGEELKALGITVDLAPDADVLTDPGNDVIGLRAFSDDPETAAQFSAAWQKGLREAGVVSAVKHFPGYGGVSESDPAVMPSVDKSYEEIGECELVPFAACIEDGAEMIVVSHILYPQIEDTAYISRVTGKEITLPASFSHAVISDILRDDLGFEGVVAVDSMEMGPVAENYNKEEAVGMAINAGADLLLVPMDLGSQEQIDKMGQLIEKIAEMAEQGEIGEERIDEAALRILKLKEKYGLLREWNKEGSQERIAAAKAAAGSAAHHQTERAIMEKGVTLLKNEEDILPLDDPENTVILCPGTYHEYAVEFALRRMREEGKLSQDAEIPVVSYLENSEEDVAEAVREADTAIAVSAVYGKDYLDPSAENGRRSALMDRILKEAEESGTKVVLISADLPWDTARFADADAVLAVYGGRGMTSLPEQTSGEGEIISPNIPAAVEAVYGAVSPQGKLPVDVYALDRKYRFTDEILYERGSGLEY